MVLRYPLLSAHGIICFGQQPEQSENKENHAVSSSCGRTFSEIRGGRFVLFQISTIPSVHLRIWLYKGLGVKMGKNVTIHFRTEVRCPERLTLGDGTIIGDNAILGTIMILNLSHRLSLYQNWAKRFLMFVGDHTLEILTWHFLSFKLVSLLIIWVYALPIEQLAGFPIIKGYSLMYWPLYSFVGICVPIGALYIRKRLSYERKTK